jgi:serine/threonine protein kinase
MTSKKLGRFDLDAEISASALGPLHRARGGDAAFLLRLVKLRPPLTKADGDTLRDAAESGFGLKHENIATFVEAVSEGNELGLFFEGRGETLATLQKRALLARKPFPQGVLLRLVADLADGVQALLAHSGEAKLHGGVTPETVIVGDDGVARVLDFLPNAAATAEPWARAPRRAAYQSPEAFRKEPLSAASDVFTLGTLAWELASNRSLFVAASLGEIEKRMLAPSKRADAMKPAGGELLDAKVADVIERALALAPAERPATPAELAALLRDAGVALATHEEIAAYLRSLTEKPVSSKTPAPSETKPKSVEAVSAEPKTLEMKSGSELLSAAARPVPKVATPAPKSAVKSSSAQLDDALDELDVVSLHSVRLPPAPPMRRPIPLGKPVPAPAPMKSVSGGEDIDVSFDEAAEAPPPPSESAKPPSSARPPNPPPPPSSAPFPLSKSVMPPAPTSAELEEVQSAEAKSEEVKVETKTEEVKSAEAKAEIKTEEAKSGEAKSETKTEEAKSEEAKSEEAKSAEVQSKISAEEAKAEEAKVEVQAEEAPPAEAKPAAQTEERIAAVAPVASTPEEALTAAAGGPAKPVQSRRAIEAPKPPAAEPKPLLLAPPTLATAADEETDHGTRGKGGTRGMGLLLGGLAAALLAVLAFALLAGGDDEAPAPAAATPAATAVEAPATAVPTAAPAPTPEPAATPAPPETAAPVATQVPAAPAATPAAPPPAATPLAAARPAPAATPKPATAKPAGKPAGAPPKGKTTKYIPGGI